MTYGTSAVNWSDDVVDNVGNTLRTDDRILGNEAANRIFSFGETRPFGAPPPENSDGDTVLATEGNDYIDVNDGDGDDTVSCGAGTDEVAFNEGDELVVPDDCETKDLRP